MARRIKGLAAAIALTLGAAGCASAPPAPPETRFTARGQEPGWLAVVEPGRTISLTLDYGERRAVTGPPSALRTPGGTVWTAPSQLGDVRLEAADLPCTDAMSGAPYPATVTLTVGANAYAGCGGPD